MTTCVKMQNTDYVYTCVIIEMEFLGWVKEMRHLNQEEKLKTDFFCRQHDCLCKKLDERQEKHQKNQRTKKLYFCILAIKISKTELKSKPLTAYKNMNYLGVNLIKNYERSMC